MQVLTLADTGRVVWAPLLSPATHRPNLTPVLSGMSFHSPCSPHQTLCASLLLGNVLHSASLNEPACSCLSRAGRGKRLVSGSGGPARRPRHSPDAVHTPASRTSPSLLLFVTLRCDLYVLLCLWVFFCTRTSDHVELGKACDGGIGTRAAARLAAAAGGGVRIAVAASGMRRSRSFCMKGEQQEQHQHNQACQPLACGGASYCDQERPAPHTSRYNVEVCGATPSRPAYGRAVTPWSDGRGRGAGSSQSVSVTLCSGTAETGLGPLDPLLPSLPPDLEEHLRTCRCTCNHMGFGNVRTRSASHHSSVGGLVLAVCLSVRP
ncbi:hypothetical protein E2C01_048405 [Portunus trituberculatus]|uniref:Uncharacterized protein n=1 Tax=Portunus trituberculatus TaxID=210409 RepID=A0A5B7GAM4_PORTR|nr:hypothetical protein [Portunus trituberculatus]